METDDERKRRWAKIAATKKLERLEREKRLKLTDKSDEFGSCSSSTSSSSSSSSESESDEENEQKQRYKRIAEMKALEKQQRIQRVANKEKQMNALRQTYNHSNNNIMNTTHNSTNLSPRMPLAVPQRISLFFNAPKMSPNKSTKQLPKQTGIIKKNNATHFNRIQNMPTQKSNNKNQNDNQNQLPKRKHVKYWSVTKVNNLEFVNAITPAQTMIVKPPKTSFFNNDTNHNNNNNNKNNNNNHYRTQTEPIQPLVFTNNSFMKIRDNNQPNEQKDIEYNPSYNNIKTQHKNMPQNEYVSYNTNYSNNNSFGPISNRNDNYNYNYNNAEQIPMYNNNNINGYNNTTNHMENISESEPELEHNNNNNNNNDYDEDSSAVSETEIPELPTNIGPPPQNKINENVDFEDIGMKTITVNATNTNVIANTIASNEASEESDDSIENDVAKALNDIKIDRYGFRVKHDNNNHVETDDKRTRVILRKENMLLQQWQNILFPSNKKTKIKWENINKKKSSDRNKINDLLKKGPIPQPFRSLVWSNLCNVNAVKNLPENQGLYEKLLSNQCNEDNEYEGIIWKDIYRTFRDNIKYEAKHNDKSKATESQKSLYNVLAAFSTYNQDIGYCQGMQAISALLLMYISEEEVFFILNTIAKSTKYGNLAFCWNMKEIHLRFNQFDLCFKEYLPKLYKHLTKNNITDVSMFGATSWFITVFISSTTIDFDLIVRIWDIYLFKGIKTIFQIGIAYLSYLEKQLLKTNSFEILITTLNNGFKIIADNKHNDKFIQSALNVKIKRKQIDKWTKKYNQL